MLGAHDHDLAIAKANKVVDIDLKTSELIYTPVAHAGHLFSMSDHGQANFLAARVLQQAGDLTYPVVWPDYDDSDQYSIADSAAFDAIWADVKTHKRTPLDSGNVLKQELIDAVDLAEVAAVVDGR